MKKPAFLSKCIFVITFMLIILTVKAANNFGNSFTLDCGISDDSLMRKNYEITFQNSSSTVYTDKEANNIKMPLGSSLDLKSLLSGIAKAFTSDDEGRIYSTGLDGDTIKIYNSSFTSLLYSIPMDKCEGIAVHRESGNIFLYATEKNEGTLSRFLISENGETITGHTLEGFDGKGIVSLINGAGITDIILTSDNKILVSNPESGTVSRIDINGKGEVCCHYSSNLIR